MQSKKAIVLVCAIVAIAVGVIAWLTTTKMQTLSQREAIDQSAALFDQAQPSPQQPTKPTQQVSQPAPVDETASAQIYTNAQYGFQLTIPQDWKNYKVVTHKDDTGASIEFQYPYNSGYVTIMLVGVQDNASYDKMVSACAGKIGQNVGQYTCYDTNAYLWGKTANYTVYRIGNEDVPTTLLHLYNQIPQIKKSFTVSQ